MRHFYSKPLGRVLHALRSVVRPRVLRHSHGVPRRQWRVPRKHVNRAAYIVGGTIAAIFFLIVSITLRLMVGPISLGLFASEIENTLNASVSGLVVHFDRAVLEWSQSEGRVNLTVLGARVFDREGHIIAQSPKAELDFDAGALLAGHTELKRFALIGIQLTAVRTKEGAVKLGFRSNGIESDLLSAVAKALESNGQTFSVWGRARNKFERFSVLKARLAFHDELTGLFVVSPDANLTVTSHGKLLDASLDASIEISGVRAKVVAEAELRDNGIPVHGALEVQGLSLQALAANSPAFSALAPLGLTLDLTANADLGDNGRVRTLDFGISGSGLAGRPKIDPVVIGIGNFRMLGRYDGVTKRLLLDELSIDGSEVKAKATGHLDIGWDEGTLTSLAGQLNVENCAFNIPSRFAAPVVFDRMALRGAYNRASAEITLDSAVLSAGKLQANLSGAATFADKLSPELDFAGTINPIAVRDFLRFWPAGLADGARSWIDANVSQGFLGKSVLDVKIPAGALDQDVLPENALSLTIPFSGVDLQYIKGLTLLTGTQGVAHLSGDTFRAEVSQGSVGPLAVSAGTVVIPDLHLPETRGAITAHVIGKVPDLLTLINAPPLGYPQRFHIDPKSTAGNIALDLDFSVPMLKDLDVGQLGIGIKARTTGLSLPLGELRHIDNANLAFTIDSKALSAQGQVEVNSVPLEFKWTEDFNPGTAVTTHVEVSGKLDEAARSRLGLPDAGLVFGPSLMSMSLVGHRAQFTGATVQADMRDTEISVPTINLEKPAGQPARLSAALRFGANSAIAVQNFVFTGSGIDVRGGFGIDAHSGLTEASLPVVRIGANDDFSVAVKTGAAGGLDVHIEGKSLDASEIFAANPRQQTKAAKAAQQVLGQEDAAFKDPLTLNIKLDRVAMKGGVMMNNFGMLAVFGANAYLQNFVLSAGLPNKETISSKFAPQPDGSRKVTVDVSDAGTFARALTGFVSMRKGTLSAHAIFTAGSAAADPAADYKGDLVLSDFTMVDQPFFARLLAAGSLAGPLNLLQGRGISFDKIEAPYSAKGKIITINDGRGSGSAVGLSFEGTIDRRSNTVELHGTLVPVYGLNSILGAVPLLGDVLVSKKGEGILGVTYAVRGDLDSPELLVNPLSMLTPGIFRRIFEFGLPSAAKAPAPVASTAGTSTQKNPLSPDAPTAKTMPPTPPVEVTPLVPLPKPRPAIAAPH